MVPTNPELTIFFFNSSTHVEKLSEILASENDFTSIAYV
jgi:hypothetical protein